MSASVNFNPESGRLDEFYHESFSNKAVCRHLWEAVKLVLILSHGQASVERGFSINREVMVVNLKEHWLIDQRVIHVLEGRKYHLHLDDQRRLKQDEQKAQKRKGLMVEKTEVKAKKKRMKDDVRVFSLLITMQKKLSHKENWPSFKSPIAFEELQKKRKKVWRLWRNS